MRDRGADCAPAQDFEIARVDTGLVDPTRDPEWLADRCCCCSETRFMRAATPGGDDMRAALPVAAIS